MTTNIVNAGKPVVTLREVEAFLLVMMSSGFTGSTQEPYIHAMNFYQRWEDLLKRLIENDYDQDSVLSSTQLYVASCLDNVKLYIGKDRTHLVSFGRPFFERPTMQFESIASFVWLMQGIVQEIKGKQTN